MSSATAILQSAPLFVVLGARIFLREKVDAKTWIAIFLGLFGVLIILRPSAADFSLLSLLALIGTLGFVGCDCFWRATGCTHALGCAIVIGAGLFIGWQNQRRQPAQ
jgi:drug/metabolite transporter (DMT)-like permease